MADVEDNKDKVKDPRVKNKRLKREKIRQKHLSEPKKKSRLEVEKANNNKEASGNKDIDNKKDIGPLAPVATSFDLLAPVTTSPSLLTLGFATLRPAPATDTSIAVCSSYFSFPIWPSFFFIPAYHTPPIFPSLMRVLRSILLPLEDDYAIQRPVSLLRISKNRL